MDWRASYEKRLDWLCSIFQEAKGDDTSTYNYDEQKRGRYIFFLLVLAVSKARLRRFKVKGIFKGDLRGKIFLNTEQCV